ncbi:MAG: TetR/AcrR family transcriptional regulator [Desulfobacterales bacterium]|jgi:AcrR family transcriptional regulator|nr:TetR/AcrR family transcriptional regulator [Desulfobacterales bacterium]
MKQEKLESILDTARKMFGRYGIQKTNLGEIASLARVAKATIYNYFGSKDQVYLEVLQREADDILKKIEAAIERVRSPIEKLRTFVSTKFRCMKEAVNIINLGRERTDSVPPKTDRIRNDLFEREVGIISSIFELGVKEGIFRTTDILLTARAIAYALRGFELTWLVEESSERIEHYLDKLIAVLFNGILVEKVEG